MEDKSFEKPVDFANTTANLKITRVRVRDLSDRKAVERFLIERKELRSSTRTYRGIMRKIYELKQQKLE